MGSDQLTFTLKPFETSSGLNIQGAILYQQKKLFLSYIVSGDVNLVKWLQVKEKSRANELWETTCFELFLQEQGEKSYLEMNFSPSGQWNIYQFDSYRTGMREFTSVNHVEVVFEKGKDNTFELRAEIDLSSFKSEKSFGAQIGVSAVIETLKNTKEYWAVEHFGAKPDFHDNRSFCYLIKKFG